MSIRLAGNIVMTRFLQPQVFGLMGLVQVFQQALTMLSDVGVGPSIIQSRRGDDPRFLNTAWTIQVARGFVLWLVSLLIAWPLAGFYHEPQLRALIPVAGVVAIICGFYSTGIFTRQRRIEIRPLVMIELCSQGFGIVLTCTWASRSPTVWALVAGVVGASAVKCGLSHRLVPAQRNRLAWDRSASKELFHFGKWIFVGTLITFLAMQGDRLVLGRLATLATFGIYNVAYAIANVPVSVLTAVASSLFYPVLSQAARESPEAMAAQVRQGRWKLLVLGAILTLGLVVEAPLFFRLLYRDRYQEAGPTAQLMAGWIWILLLGTTLEPALRALGDSRSTAVAQGIRFLATSGATIVGFHAAGLAGFLGGLTLGALAGHLVLLYALAQRGIHVLREDVVFTAGGASLAALACAPRVLGGHLSFWGREALVQTLLVVTLLTIAGVARRRLRALPNV